MKRVLIAGVVLLLTTTFIPSASAATLDGPLVQVSGASPFTATCGTSEPGILFPDSEVEPYVDVNPDLPENIVGVWQQDRWSNGGSRGNVAGVSMDGGASWQVVPLPGVTQCTGGPFVRASDPWVSFSPDGTVYAMSLAFNNQPPPGRPGGFGANAMLVNRSTDGGLTWGPPTTLAFDDNPRLLNDKNTLTADPNDADFVYAVWDRLSVPNGTVINPENVIGLGFKGPVRFTRTTNGGQSWEPVRTIYDPAANNQTIGNQIVVQPDGTVVDFFNEILNFKNSDGGGKFEFNLALLTSEDNGATWSKKPVRAQKIQSLGAVTPDTGAAIRDAAILFDVAVGPNGNLYAVWQDTRFTGGQFDTVALSRSTDGGATWSAPIQVSKTPSGAGLRSQAFLPSVEVNTAGVVAVSYYDFRNDVPGTPADELADHFVVTCTASCAQAASFAAEVRVTDTSFDYLDAPQARGLFLGDYEGLGTDGTDFFPFFSATHTGDAASVFVRRVGP
ncbi:MAG TPA: sialidase family protein [Mycobacterium sp.]